jgi:hypothetical protein
MGMFSVLGHRTPELEGKPGAHSKMMMEINNYFRKSFRLSAQNSLKFLEE